MIHKWESIDDHISSSNESSNLSTDKDYTNERDKGKQVPIYLPFIQPKTLGE